MKQSRPNFSSMYLRKAVGILMRPFASSLAGELPLSIGCHSNGLCLRVARGPAGSNGTARLESARAVPVFPVAFFLMKEDLRAYRPLKSTLGHRANIERHPHLVKWKMCVPTTEIESLELDRRRYRYPEPR